MPKPLSCHHALELVDAPVTTPISLTEVKAQLRVEHTDDDTLLTRLLNTAVSFTDVRGALGKAMITQKWGQWVPPSPGEVRLILGPFQGLTAVKYYDTDGVLQTATLTDFEVIGPAALPIVRPKTGYSWPTTQSRSDAIKLEYTIGYGDAATDVPDIVRHALLMLVAHWYENREQTSQDVMTDVPFGFTELMNIERNCWYG